MTRATRLILQLSAKAAVVVAAIHPASVPSQSPSTPPVSAPTNASGKRVLSIEDYKRWRAIESASISSDGNWVAYVLRLTNVLPADSRPEVRIRRLGANDDVVVADASAPMFSPDSRWIVYQLDSVPARGGGRGRGAAPADTTLPGAGRAAVQASPAAPRRLELRELATGRTQHWQDIQSATFSHNSTHLLLRRRGPAGASGGSGGGGRAGGGAPGAPRGGDALLHELATGRTQFLGSVGEAAFNRDGDLLAYTVETSPRDGNGLYVVDLASGATYTLENDDRVYARLTWNDAGTGIAVLKGRPVERLRERDNVLVVYPNVRHAFAPSGARPVRLDTSTAGFPRGFVVSDRAPLAWSEDDSRVFFGIIPQTAAPDTARRRSTDSIPDVDIWRTQDERIQSVQMVRAEADRNFTFRQALLLDGARFVRLTDSSMRDIDVSLDGRWAVGRDGRAYVSDYGRPQADFYRVNTSTGERTLMFKAQIVQHTYGISPDGRRFLYWKDGRYHQYDLDAAAASPVNAAGAPNFVDTEYDYPGPRPPYGIAGYTPDGAHVIVNHRYDLWQLPLATDGQAKNLTSGDGARREIRFRIARPEPEDPMASRRARSGREIDLSRPVTLSAFGQITKKGGFFRLEGGTLREIVFDDAVFSTPERAQNAERYLFTRQTFTEYPDLRVAGSDWKDALRISDANPQHAEYAWGRREVFQYRLRDGTRLQGILAVPDDYRPGERRPMIVTFYEKNSQNANRYTPPSFISGMGTVPIEAVSRGYITMLPDVHFRTGSSHSDMLEAVEAATKKVIEMGYADPARIGVHGHSYGGEGAAFIATQSKMFAAVAMGAGVTDLFTDFSQSWGWSYQVTGGSGANGNDYYLFGQGRWGFSPWDKPDVYRFESAITHADKVSMPVLIMHGTADPTVSFSEGMNFYNALRYNKKNAILLAYPNEGHGLRGLANREDLTRRYFEFFDHHLKGAPAPKWMTDGVPYLVKTASQGPGTAR